MTSCVWLKSGSLIANSIVKSAVARKSIYARLVNNSRRTFEQTCGHRPENKPTEMRQISHTARLYLRDSTCMRELGQEPNPNQERGRNERIKAVLFIFVFVRITR